MFVLSALHYAGDSNVCVNISSACTMGYVHHTFLVVLQNTSRMGSNDFHMHDGNQLISHMYTAISIHESTYLYNQSPSIFSSVIFKAKVSEHGKVMRVRLQVMNRLHIAYELQ